MHAFIRVIAWVGIMLFLAFVEQSIPRDENALRNVTLLTFMLWLVVGVCYGLRGVWRFMRA